VPPPTLIGAGLDALQAIIRARGERASRASAINETRRSSCENARVLRMSTLLASAPVCACSSSLSRSVIIADISMSAVLTEIFGISRSTLSRISTKNSVFIHYASNSSWRFQLAESKRLITMSVREAITPLKLPRITCYSPDDR
jgi:hypothetical protein